MAGSALAVAIAAFASTQFAIGRPVASLAWLAIAPLLGSLALRPLRTVLLAVWTVLLGLGLALGTRGPAGRMGADLGRAGPAGCVRGGQLRAPHARRSGGSARPAR